MPTTHRIPKAQRLEIFSEELIALRSTCTELAQSFRPGDPEFARLLTVHVLLNLRPGKLGPSGPRGYVAKCAEGLLKSQQLELVL